MSEIFMVEGGERGRCRCGHRSKKGEVYILVEEEKGGWTICERCMVKKGMKGKRVRVEELRERWFGKKSPLEVLVGGV